MSVKSTARALDRETLNELEALSARYQVNSNLRHADARGQADRTVVAKINEMSAAFGEFRDRQDAELAVMNSAILELQAGQDELAKKNARLGMTLGADTVSTSTALKPLAKWMKNPQAAMRVGSDPDGGFTVTPEMDDVIARFQLDKSPMRRRCRVVMTNHASWEKVFSQGGTASGWVGESQSRASLAGSSLAKISIPTHEIYAYPEATQTLLEDSAFNIEAFVSEEIVEEFEDKESAAYVSGDGVMKPKGFLSYDKSTEADEARAFGTIQYFESGSASGFPALSGVPGAANADALFDVVYGLRSGYRSNAAWMMNSATAGYLRKLKDGDGRPLWSESLIQGQPPTLIGYPVEMNEDMPDIGSDDFPIAFADWEAAYTIVDRRGVRVIRDDVTNKPYVGFYTTKRVGGGLIDSRAIKLLKTAAS